VLKEIAMLRSILVAALLVGTAAVACGNDDEGSGDGGGNGGSSGSGGTGMVGPPCSSEDDCGAATAHCDMDSGRCTGCTTDDDCRGELLCDTATGICRDCVDDGDCDGDRPTCDRVSGQCSAECTSDADCAANDGPHTCDTTRGRCVDCIGNGMPCEFCELETYSCVGCLTDDDCSSDEPYCGPSHECSPECADDGDCSNDLVCDAATSRCVECATNADCPGEVCQRDYTCG
jgi:Cys-rich repeat protein